VNRKLVLSALAIATLLIASTAFSQTRTRANAPDNTLSFLPGSDGVMVVDARRLLNETLPQVFAGDSAKLAQVNSDIDKFKTETGLDPRSLTRIVVGTRYVYPEPGMTKLKTIAIARGTFDPKAIAATGRAKTQGYREENFGGKTIMIFSVNDQMRVLGLAQMKIGELAFVALDKQTLAMGTLDVVRATIAAQGAPGLRNAGLIALATRDATALIGFAGNITPQLTANLNVGSDAMGADVKSIRQVYGSIGSSQTNLSLTLVARTDTPASEKTLSDTVTGLTQLGAIFILRMTGPRKALAESALANLKISATGNEMQIKTEFPASGLASFVK
jgi:hypothetical protein